LYRDFSNAKLKIEPCARGKNVKKLLWHSKYMQYCWDYAISYFYNQ
jgi:hypothetical protein